ncbi:MAG TPA: putative metal-binding motif-containing protein [Pseudomonadota bacterium]|nr:putative metal-binding motif-containing protein [Pseudomonadota bacterium]
MRTMQVRAGMGLVVTAALGMAVGCGSEPAMKRNPFAPLPDCSGPALAFGKGEQGMVIADLRIAAAGQGFDLDEDGTIDNKLGALSSLANGELEDVFKIRHDVVIPMEFNGLKGTGDSDCTKFALYLGQFNQDRDTDGKDTTWEDDDDAAKGDCNDHDKEVRPGHAEDLTNRMDDDCDGKADNPGKRKPPTDMMDLDGDGYTLAQGDCDDRMVSPMVPTGTDMQPLAKLRHPMAEERCDGYDYNCDGIPDNSPACDPFADANVKLPIQKVSLDGAGKPLLAFNNGGVKGGKLSSGPSLFRVAVPVSKDFTLELELSGTRIQGSLRERSGRLYLDDANLGGVLQAVSLARLDKINLKGFLTPPQSLFDAIWASSGLATILMLKRDADDHVLPDMDVDGDGLETFWASDPGKTPALVDTCRDGDGTIIKNGDASFPNDDAMKRCVFAKDARGNYRFVDGISAALRFKAVPARIGDLVESTIGK